jgi:hypothetical protein
MSNCVEKDVLLDMRITCFIFVLGKLWCEILYDFVIWKLMDKCKSLKNYNWSKILNSLACYDICLESIRMKFGNLDFKNVNCMWDY